NHSSLRTWARVMALANFPISLTTGFAIPLLSRFQWYRELQMVVASICAILLMLYLMGMTSRLQRIYVAASMRSLMLLYIGMSGFVTLFRLLGLGAAPLLGPFWMLLTAINSFAE